MHPHRLDARTEEVTTTVDIAATPDRVFTALTDPEELSAWFVLPDTIDPDSEQVWSVDPRPGGEWSMTTIGADGERAGVHGEYLVVNAPHELVFTWAASWDDDLSATVRYHLTPRLIGDVHGTRLDVTHTSTNAVMARTGIPIAPFNARDTIASLANYLLGQSATSDFDVRGIFVADEARLDTYTVRPWMSARGRATITA